MLIRVIYCRFRWEIGEGGAAVEGKMALSPQLMKIANNNFSECVDLLRGPHVTPLQASDLTARCIVAPEETTGKKNLSTKRESSEL